EIRTSRGARAGERLRAPDQAEGARLPRPRPDARRHRRPGGQGDRSGTATFLSPLRARPALRRSGQARVAGPAGGGRRAQSNSPPHLRVPGGLRAPATKARRRARAPTISARLSDGVTLEAQASGEIVARYDGYSAGLGTFSAAAADRVRDLR